MESNQTVERQIAPNSMNMSRRQALMRLGLAAGVAYATPVVLHLDREAKAMMVSTPCPAPDGNCGNNPVECTC